ncbi:seryl-tRNA synthetase [Thermosipho africanus TCF52B]|uniref:Serine--tRNA ligase n=1 Tax=Thermosipho africanus (strain TCF52B) TaxID=484019 RepID=SYS_THEAB|nr:serine--tRNA ligase [Thermosipho africanus]B7IFW4.1 RecName: Full=Serine--tRNA ligase; AltName: Full=Seryl-tRNA synthetase; Short=SerRS; AltName: Full=Seryl-tRNA(Ser/Sec) synthetase [Thermosipho africanus TCF52B]ACJ74978.1 seryl-tRNA synthetase [Thermosipho africanus TCF52B]
MIDVKLLRKNPEIFYDAIKKRNMDTEIIDKILEVDKEWRELVAKVNELKAKRNEFSKLVAKAKVEKDNEKASKLIEESKKIGEEIKKIEEQEKKLEEEMQNLALNIPNIPAEDVPFGKDESENIEIRRWGEPRKFDFEPKAHWDLGPELSMMDFERGAKLSGSRFTVLYSYLARLERALIQFMLDVHTKEHGYTEVWVPQLVKRDAMLWTGKLPKFEEDAYCIEKDDMFLIPTAEVPLVALHAQEILSEKDLPIKYTAYSACYRREAGSYGKDVRGMIRQHQFDKVELVWITTPERSFEDLERLTQDAERILQLLELPYRVVSLCSGDLGFVSAKTYDIEVWLPSYNSYKEISSCSNTTDFQTRRSNIRYRGSDNKLHYAHALNGSGLAVGRTLVAIVENYQNEDGSITVPKVLVPYMGVEKIEVK